MTFKSVAALSAGQLEIEKMNYAIEVTAGSNVPTPQQPIPQALGQLGTAIHEMGVLSDTLANRLGVVLMPAATLTGVAGGKAPADTSPPTSQQADEIHAYRRRVENIAAQLRDVLNRLEV
jgi:hypothetical protein